LGIVSIYIGLIYEEVKGRPNFVIRETRGFGNVLPRPESSGMIIGGESAMSNQDAQRGVRRLISEPVRTGATVNALTTTDDAPSAVRGS
jgi:hypothetical protein